MTGALVLYFAIVCPSLMLGQTQSVSVPSTSDTRPCGTFSDHLIYKSAANRSEYPQAHLLVDLMSSRYRDLLWVADGYRLTNMPLVAYDGKSLFQTAPGDDPGLYYLIPAVSRVFRLGLERSIDLVLVSALLLGFAVGFSGCLYALKSTAGKAVSLFALLLLTAIAYRTGDVYVFEFATTVALVPWVLYLIRCKDGAHWTFQVSICMFGLICGICSLIRFGSVLPVIAILAILLPLSVRARAGRKVALIVLFFVSFLIPRAYLRHLLTRSDAFVHQSVAGYRQANTRHVFGHFAYEGLGFLSNPYIPGGICDEVAKEKVQAIAPGAAYMSSEYDHILQREVLSIAKQHPTIVAFTIFAKLGIIAGLIAVFANVGLFAALWYPKSPQVEFAFWTAFAISSAPLVLMAPLPMYCLGVISLAVVYGIVSLDHCLVARKLARLNPIQPQRIDDRAPVFVK